MATASTGFATNTSTAASKDNSVSTGNKDSRGNTDSAEYAATAASTGTSGYTVSAIPPSSLDRIRARGIDDFGNPVKAFLNQNEGGTPLRCCLREAALGERVALIAYQPADRGGPYAEVGPVFMHADRCAGYPSEQTYPEGFRHRQQLFRAYDVDGRAVHNQLAEPAEVDSVIAELLARPDVDFIHSRNAIPGCYMFAITRVNADPR